LPAPWTATYVFTGIALAGLGGLAFVHLVFRADEVPIAEAPRAEETTFERRWAALGIDAKTPQAALSERTLAIPRSDLEAESTPDPVAVAAVAPAIDQPRALDTSEPERYIFYYNSPTHWTPVPLPEAIAEDRAPHNRNIRAEIEQAAMLFDVDIRMMKAFARIESGYNPKVTTGKYKCLFQLSDWEFAKYWRGDIYDIRDCSIAAARKLATEAAQFEKDVGRRATAAEIYCIHQQGYQGCAFHYAAPHQLAWKNMYLTAEGQERGEAWARKAIWGNVPSDIKDKIKGGVDALTSGEFIAIWTERVERFMARKSEPPTDYVEYSSKAKKPAKAADKTGKPSKVAVSAKNKRVADQSNKKRNKNKVKLAAR
jgi:hypothetical protein